MGEGDGSRRQSWLSTTLKTLYGHSRTPSSHILSRCAIFGRILLLTHQPLPATPVKRTPSSSYRRIAHCFRAKNYAILMVGSGMFSLWLNPEVNSSSLVVLVAINVELTFQEPYSLARSSLSPRRSPRKGSHDPRFISLSSSGALTSMFDTGFPLFYTEARIHL